MGGDLSTKGCYELYCWSRRVTLNSCAIDNCNPLEKEMRSSPLHPQYSIQRTQWTLRTMQDEFLGW